MIRVWISISIHNIYLLICSSGLPCSYIFVHLMCLGSIDGVILTSSTTIVILFISPCICWYFLLHNATAVLHRTLILIHVMFSLWIVAFTIKKHFSLSYLILVLFNLTLISRLWPLLLCVHLTICPAHFCLSPTSHSDNFVFGLSLYKAYRCIMQLRWKSFFH